MTLTISEIKNALIDLRNRENNYENTTEELSKSTFYKFSRKFFNYKGNRMTTEARMRAESDPRNFISHIAVGEFLKLGGIKIKKGVNDIIVEYPTDRSKPSILRESINWPLWLLPTLTILPSNVRKIVCDCPHATVTNLALFDKLSILLGGQIFKLFASCISPIPS